MINRYSLIPKTILSMTLKELEPQLLALNPAEKAQAIQLLVQSLSNAWQGIEKTPGVWAVMLVSPKLASPFGDW